MYKYKLKIPLIIVGVSLLAACSSSSDADNEELPEDYPDQTVEVLVGFEAGGGTDLSARNMVEVLNSAEIVEQDFVVENLTGAGGALALRELANNDEYTLNAVPETGEGVWNGQAGGLELSDFTPVAQVATDYQVIAVPSDSPHETVEDLLNDSGSINIPMASTLDGIESFQWHQIDEDYDGEAELNLIPRDGGNEALTDLLSGDADAAFVVPQIAEDHVEDGNLKPLAVTTEERTDHFPDVPTLIEEGIDVTYLRPRGFWLNGDVSDAVANYWENALQEMTETDEWGNYVEESGLILEFQGSEEYRDYIEEEGSEYREFFQSMQ